MIQCPKCGGSSFHPRVSVKPNEILQQLRSSIGFTDQALTNQALHDAEKDLGDYDTEIARLETAISVLKYKRERLEDYVAKCRSLLSPIRRLPPEILSLIFLFQCRKFANMFNLYEPDKTLPAFVLSQVCTGWRNVALNTPTMWSNLDIAVGWCSDPSGSRSKDIDLALPLIRQCLNRSSQAPLTLTLYFWGPLHRENDFSSILKALAATSHRWYSLEIQCDDNERDTELLSLWSQDVELSSLERLETSASTLESLLEISTHLRRAPLLSCLFLDFVKHESGLTKILVLPLAQITSLTLSCYETPPENFEILRQCIHLTDLVLVWDDNRSWGPPSRVGTNFATTLDRLDNLRFEIWASGATFKSMLSNLFSKITAPALKDLTISCESYHCKENWSPNLGDIAEFVKRSGCTLSHLWIQASIIDSDCLSLLHLFPDLKVLTIEESVLHPISSRTITDSFINGLRTTHHHTSSVSEGQSNTPCIPQLLHLSLYVYRPSFRPEMLNEMIRSRWIPDPTYSSEVGIACLRSIKVIGREKEVEQTLAYASLGELEKSGLQVEILGL
ncbi:hypothetical protein K435DRAFT_777549 [Dendrothele bispora CBS 962.96]|uniref:Uncharacterized protein n=1 Tax=Dendrothele bispora (strain CBS 962.96) TaxID=1314807 RepID=A0A4S8M8Z4_DENBC|nr:hypothetical protein K435DRAFT_777549 [Dendrothele bispora CBS 962.96]